MRIVDDAAIRRHAAVRFRSEYDYAVFEYWRSAKVLAYLEKAGITTFDRVLDDGCGGGGMCVSFAEEARSVVGIEPGDRFRDVGTRLAAEKGVTNVRFTYADGTALPFRDGAFDLVLSHSVIEHVANPLAYLKEARRVLAPGGVDAVEHSAISLVIGLASAEVQAAVSTAAASDRREKSRVRGGAAGWAGTSRTGSMPIRGPPHSSRCPSGAKPSPTISCTAQPFEIFAAIFAKPGSSRDAKTSRSAGW